MAFVPCILMSAIYHEYVLWAPLRFVLPVLLFQYSTFGRESHTLTHTHPYTHTLTPHTHIYTHTLTPHTPIYTLTHSHTITTHTHTHTSSHLTHPYTHIFTPHTHPIHTYTLTPHTPHTHTHPHTHTPSHLTPSHLTHTPRVVFVFALKPSSHSSWNYLIHVGLQVGVSVMVFCYVMEFNARITCPKEENAVNTFVPRFLDCYFKN